MELRQTHLAGAKIFRRWPAGARDPGCHLSAEAWHHTSWPGPALSPAGLPVAGGARYRSAAKGPCPAGQDHRQPGSDYRMCAVLSRSVHRPFGRNREPEADPRTTCTAMPPASGPTRAAPISSSAKSSRTLSRSAQPSPNSISPPVLLPTISAFSFRRRGSGASGSRGTMTTQDAMHQ